MVSDGISPGKNLDFQDDSLLLFVNTRSCKECISISTKTATQNN